MYWLGDEDLKVKPLKSKCPHRRVRRRHGVRFYNYRAAIQGNKKIVSPGKPARVVVPRLIERAPGQPVIVKPGPRSMELFGGGPSELGASLNVLPAGFTGFTSSFTPSAASAPAPASSGGIFDSIVNLWNSRPDVLKKIRIRMKPQAVAQQAQRIIGPNQVQQMVDYARAQGIDPTYLTQYGEVPVTGALAKYGYQYQAGAFDNLSSYVPYILGAGAVLAVVASQRGSRP